MDKRRLFSVTMVCLVIMCFLPVRVLAVGLQDGYEIIENHETKKCKETPCFVSAETICPEGFGLNTYAMLQNQDGQIFRISMSAENGYVGQIYLAPGSYQVIEVSVFDDYKQEYPFEVEEQQFVLEKNENHMLSFKLKEYDSIQQAINKKTQVWEDAPTDVILTDDIYYTTGLLNVKMKGTGELYYKVVHKGSGLGEMECAGNATGNYDVVVKIIKSGVIGEAQFKISIDGGKNYIGQDIVGESSKVGDAGLTLYFHTEQDSMEFIEGDEYCVTVPETYPVTASRVGETNLIVKGQSGENYDFNVTILSSGGMGQARFKVESTKGEEINLTDVIPADGVYQLKDGLSLLFAESMNYEKGMVYSVCVRSNDDTKSYTSVYVLIGIVIFLVAAAIAILSKQVDRKEEYRIRKYIWRKDEKYYE